MPSSKDSKPLNGLIWFGMNRLPKYGKWVYDHIMVVNCPNVIPKDKQVKTLLDKMHAEHDSIVYKAVRLLPMAIGSPSLQA